MAVRRSYPPETASAHRAQEFVAQLVGGPAFDTIAIRIVTSELVMNAVRHARTDATLTVTPTSDHVRIEVADGDGNCDLRPMRPTTDSETGRGLLFVDELARTWGVEPTRTGKTVWAVMDRPALSNGLPT
jgi:anti-sigma regulatory factor (Ser/Thr protein kinase)